MGVINMIAGRTLNGWQRLWIVLAAGSFIYAVAWGFGKVASSPFQIDENVVAGFTNPQCRNIILMPATSKLNPEPKFEDPCWPVYSYRHFYENAATTSVGYTKDLETRHREARLISIGVALVMWLVGVSLIYGAGVIVGWIRKGFQSGQR